MNSPQKQRWWLSGYPTIAGLVGVTLAAVAVHGYHVGVEDEGIYLPAILKHLDPSLYPHDSILFEAQTAPTLFDEMVAGIVRTTHLPLEWVLFLLHLLSIFLLLIAAARLVERCFPARKDRWAALGLLTGLFAIPIAGTAQFIVEQYAHPRALATGLILLPVADLLPGAVRMSKWKLAFWCAACFLPAFVLHLQMAVFGLGLLVFLSIPWERWIGLMRSQAPLFVAVPMLGRLFLGRLFGQGSAAWQEAARTRTQHYLLHWQWYELLGIIAPMFLLWWWGRVAEDNGEDVLAWFSRRIALYSLLVLVVGGCLVLPPAFERFTPLQPMRMFIFVYFYMLLLGGGLIGQFLLRKAPWRWLVLFVPIATGMYIGERVLFPDSPHIEWPGKVYSTPWIQACLWVRQNTPNDAYFALNPDYYDEPGVDSRGFRAWARRSQLADRSKDGGVASIVPMLAPRWQKEVHAVDGWNRQGGVDFPKLRADLGVDWVVLGRQVPGGTLRELPDSLECPYRNEGWYVCRIR